MKVGIEAINVFAGRAKLDVKALFSARGLDLAHFDNLMMRERSIHLPWEDPVTMAVNAAKPLLSPLSEAELSNIEVVITSSESGIDFGKSISNYAHRYLGLPKRLRLFEVKQACYGSTAALQMASNYIAASSKPETKVLILSADIARSFDKMSYSEPSLGAGAVAMLVGANPRILEIERGQSGLHAYEVMDTCRPAPSVEAGDPDLSLLSYIGCLEHCARDYLSVSQSKNLLESFEYLVFHTPFAGMVKGAFRHLMRKLEGVKPKDAEVLFQSLVTPSLHIPQLVGNLYSASVYSALISLILSAEVRKRTQVGLFAYGSGCSSEFFSGFIGEDAFEQLRSLNVLDNIHSRMPLDVERFDQVFAENSKWFFGVENGEIPTNAFEDIYSSQYEGNGYLVLDRITNYERKYKWS